MSKELEEKFINEKIQNPTGSKHSHSESVSESAGFVCDSNNFKRAHVHVVKEEGFVLHRLQIS